MATELDDVVAPLSSAHFYQALAEGQSGRRRASAGVTARHDLRHVRHRHAAGTVGAVNVFHGENAPPNGRLFIHRPTPHPA
ncbi:hypothetical protein DAETH_38620 (plasmid) [Deinococcus aetherius]|uniref:Uncharacterized protein n=1 Tax=Deinococcus aetherius TaxID=200252 RepID=A0ABM8AJ96_9DEIO|nr:hypothetical protein DAETH_38620 [Deinococcus aetherius]